MKYQPFAPWLYTITRFILLPLIRWVYKIEIENKEVFKEIKPPFIVMANHTSFFDGFMVASGISHPVHFLVTDSVLQGILGFLIRKTGAIPITKNLIDISAIRKMYHLKQQNKVIAIFPEAQTTWHGNSGKIYPSMAKLVKILKIPVVAVKVKGAYHLEPKWSKSKRKGKMVVEYIKLLMPDEIKSFDREKIVSILEKGIEHNDLDFITARKLVYPSKNGAEYLERALSWCPNCGSLGKLSSKENQLNCLACEASWDWVGDGYIRPCSDNLKYGDQKSPDKISIEEWVLSERKVLPLLIEKMKSSEGEDDYFLYPPDPAMMNTGYRGNKRQRLGEGFLGVIDTGYVFITNKKERFYFPFKDVDASQVVEANTFEFYYKGVLYEFPFIYPYTSGLKYLNVLRIKNPSASELN